MSAEIIRAVQAYIGVEADGVAELTTSFLGLGGLAARRRPQHSNHNSSPYARSVYMRRSHALVSP